MNCERQKRYMRRPALRTCAGHTKTGTFLALPCVSPDCVYAQAGVKLRSSHVFDTLLTWFILTVATKSFMFIYQKVHRAWLIFINKIV